MIKTFDVYKYQRKIQKKGCEINEKRKINKYFRLKIQEKLCFWTFYGAYVITIKACRNYSERFFKRYFKA